MDVKVKTFIEDPEHKCILEEKGYKDLFMNSIESGYDMVSTLSSQVDVVISPELKQYISGETEVDKRYIWFTYKNDLYLYIHKYNVWYKMDMKYIPKKGARFELLFLFSP